MNFNINTQYSFEVYPSAILGQDFKAVEVLAIMNASSAQREEDVASLHRQVYAHLPAGTPESYLHQTYLKVLTAAGTTRMLAQSWIRPESVIERQSLDARIILADTTPQDTQAIQQALSQAGFVIRSIDFIN